MTNQPPIAGPFPPSEAGVHHAHRHFSHGAGRHLAGHRRAPGCQIHPARPAISKPFIAACNTAAPFSSITANSTPIRPTSTPWSKPTRSAFCARSTSIPSPTKPIGSRSSSARTKRPRRWASSASRSQAEPHRSPASAPAAAAAAAAAHIARRISSIFGGSPTRSAPSSEPNQPWFRRQLNRQFRAEPAGVEARVRRRPPRRERPPAEAQAPPPAPISPGKPLAAEASSASRPPAPNNPSSFTRKRTTTTSGSSPTTPSPTCKPSAAATPAGIGQPSSNTLRLGRLTNSSTTTTELQPPGTGPDPVPAPARTHQLTQQQ